MSHLSNVASISLLDKNGVIVNSTIQWPMPHTDISDREQFQQVKNNADRGIYVSNPIVERFSGVQTIFFLKRINEANNEFLGIIAIGVRQSYFQHIYESITSLRNMSFLFLRQDGTVIVRYPDTNDRSGEKMPAASPWYHLVSQGGGYYRSPGYFDGIARQIAVVPLRDYPLVINVAVSEYAALTSWRIQAMTIGLGTLLVLFCMALLLKALSKQFRRLATSEAKVDVALNNMSQGLAMFGRDRKLIVCNARYAEIYHLPPELMRPGTSQRQILEHRLASGVYTENNSQNYMDERINSAAQAIDSDTILKLSNGRVLAVSHRALRDGGWVSTHQDITDKIHAENVSKEQKDQLDAALNNMHHGLLMFDSEGRLVLYNQRFLQIYHLPPEAVKLGCTLSDLLRLRKAAGTFKGDPDQYVAKLVAADRTFTGDPDRQMAKIFDNGQVETKIMELPDGRIISITNQSTPGHGWVSTHEDITERRHAEQERDRNQEFLDLVVENVPAPILVKWVSNRRYVLVNRAAEEFFGVSRDKIIGKTSYEVFPKEEADLIVARDEKLLQSDQPLFDERQIHTPCNGIRNIASKRLIVRDNAGEPRYFLGVIEDVTERRRTEERILYLAHNDSLTSLPNRATFVEHIAATLNKASKTGEQFALLSIDLDYFKETNDVYGHTVGDALLCEVARRLNAAAGGAFLARVGGDEFLLIVNGPQPAAAEMLGERLLAAVRDNFEVDGHRLRLGLSIGGAVYPTDGTDAKTLMTNADAALYRAKAESRGSVRFFEAEMGARLRERRELQNDLRVAVSRSELFLHYQPQKKMTGETIGFEALARWQCQKRGMVAPGTFIPIAEECDLIIPLGEWILREACREAASWPQPLTIAVNISPVQFRHGNLPNLVHSVLLETGLAPARLELEITEGVLIDDFSRAVSILRKLKSLGVQIAMDDFGTGYSSLSYLHAFPFDKIKIDRTFVGDLEYNRHSMAIVRAVIGLGHSLDVPILAEGVETEAQHDFLAHEGCDEVQGYLTGHPLPIEDYAELVGHQAIAKKSYLVSMG
jgi:diguanylate cyclase (GGDEF)-like protein/PAS domain S-box-containing protein